MTTAQQRYSAYRKTPHWKKVSTATKKAAGYRCQVCNSPHDLDAHHRTYEHRANEMDHLGDMICLCRRCHNIFHGKEDGPIQLYQAPARRAVTYEDLNDVSRVRVVIIAPGKKWREFSKEEYASFEMLREQSRQAGLPEPTFRENGA